MTDLRRRSSYSSCSLPPLHSWKRGRAAGRGRSSWKGEGGLLLDWER